MFDISFSQLFFYVAMFGFGSVIFGSFFVVKHQNVYLVETLGRYSRTLTPGLNFIIPLVESVSARIDLRIQETRTGVDVKTKDNVFVKLPVSLMSKVLPERASDFHYSLQDSSEQVSSWVLNELRAKVAQMNLSEVFEDRTGLVEAVTDALQERLGSYGVEIVAVIVDQPEVSEVVKASFDNVISAKRQLDAATTLAEAKLVQVVGQAKADAQGQEHRATGFAKARSIIVENLLTTASKGHGEAPSQSEILNFLLETNRLDAIREAATHGRMVVMDLRGPNTANINIATDESHSSFGSADASGHAKPAALATDSHV